MEYIKPLLTCLVFFRKREIVFSTAWNICTLLFPSRVFLWSMSASWKINLNMQSGYKALNMYLTIKTRKKITILCIRSSLFDVANSKKLSWLITTFMEHTRLCRVLFWILYEFMQYIVDGWKNHSEMPIDHPGKQRIIRVKEFLTSTKLQLTWDQFNIVQRLL